MSFKGSSIECFAMEFGMAYHPQLDRYVPPAIGEPESDFKFWADAKDSDNVPFQVLADYLKYVTKATNENSGEAKVTIWKDERHEDAIIAFTFQASVAEVSYGSILPSQLEDALEDQPETLDQVLYVSLEPVVDKDHKIKIVAGN